MRELGGMRRLVEDDISARACSSTDLRGLAQAPHNRRLEELTSRKNALGCEIPTILDRLGRSVFDPPEDACSGV